VSSYDIAYRLEQIWQERVTKSPKFIDTDHAYVHEGNAFDAWVTSTVSAVHRFKTPAATATYPYIHWRPSAVSVNAGNLIFQVYDTNTSGDKLTGGSTFAPVNRKYSSTKTSGVTFTVGVAASSTDGYVEKYRRLAHGGTGPGQTAIGVSKGEALEWILKPDTEYAIYITVSAATDVGLNLFWYEEADA
jgi:hypothetical protein